MATATRSRGKKGSRKTQRGFVQKARGVIHPRVQKAGPEHFGIVCFDCAKARSKWMLCDFYGNVLIPPSVVTHVRGDVDAAIQQLREAIDNRQIKDLIIAIERTGNYHLPVKRAYVAAGFDTRIVHPFATKQFRQPADPGNKTDETDLAAIFRAAVAGFSHQEPASSDVFVELRLLARLRRDLVQKRSAVCCQIREHLEAIMPGYAACFEDLWESQIALEIVRHFPSPQALAAAGIKKVVDTLKAAGRRVISGSVEKVMAWANVAAMPDPAATVHHRILQMLCDDYSGKCREIAMLECDMARLLAQTPYVLLMSFPGINVVSAGELAGEMGPIEHYPNAKAITGRAGLFPSRYQSDEVDAANGSLIRCANRSLRAILMMIADNLIQCNAHFRSLAAVWRSQGKDPRHSHVKIACRFSRIVFQLVAGKQVFRHPGCAGRDYILHKLLKFLREHDAAPSSITAILQSAINHLPVTAQAEEAVPLQQELQKIVTAKRGPKPIGEILTVVLARLGISDLQSTSSEEQDPS